MKVTGFSIVRNAIAYDYPIVEAVKSILPLCDDFIIAVGKSEDATLDLVRNISPEKIRTIETIWDDSLREGGRTLALETDKAFQAIPSDTDWCFYIQADEVVHENSLNNIYNTMLKWKDDAQVEGLLFNYLHFFGSYKYLADSYNWYRKEIRAVRKNKNIFSYQDAQGFRKQPNDKLKVKQVDATIFHYGWVKNPVAQQRKQETFHKMWRDDTWIDKNISKVGRYDYSTVDSLRIFEGNHPTIMKERIAKADWSFDFDTTKNQMKWRYRVKKWIEEVFGIVIGEYKNYVLIK